MSGHNKWSQIKHQKGAVDAKKSKLFAMLGRQIAVETKKAGGDKNNPGLRKAIEKARAANMPSENIERAIERGTGGAAGELEEVMYEAYGPGGVALIIEGITDNKNRTSQEIKHLLDLHGGDLASPGAAAWAFIKTASGDWQAKTLLPLGAAEKQRLAELTATLEKHNDVKNIVANASLGD